jgi:acyl-CoA synthetase (AMP-forming)/AMP-acid ligase II
VRDGPGELLVATTTMMSRYWGSSELTSEAFVDKRFPSSSSTRWYRTGDLVMANGDGDLIFLGRADNQVKIRGQRVELEAIDLTIRSLEGVSEVATVAIDDDLGEGRLVAVIQNEPGASIELRDVQRAVGARHPRAAVPVDIVVVDRLTRTATAKVDRNAALEHAVIAGRR